MALLLGDSESASPWALPQLRGALTCGSQVACATDMMLFGYDQGVFSMLLQILLPVPNTYYRCTILQAAWS